VSLVVLIEEENDRKQFSTRVSSLLDCVENESLEKLLINQELYRTWARGWD